MAIKTAIVLKTDADSFIPDNTTRLISPMDVRDRLKDLADSMINRVDDNLRLNLRTYVTSRPYEVGEHAVYSGVLYQCITATSGTFNPTNRINTVICARW